VAAQLDFTTGTIEKILGGTDMMINCNCRAIAAVKGDVAATKGNVRKPLFFRWCWWQLNLTS
jgi:hypothetical protein